MALKNDYLQIAKRALKASNDTRKVQEKSAFLAYHAFESAGCALADHDGQGVGPSVSHNQKIQRFQQAAVNHCDSATQSKIATTAVLLHNLRNKLLYPNYDASSGTFSRPENMLTQSQSNSLRNDVKGIADEVGKII
ncbi:hypothetical protein [Alloalcanivorax marinus]|uniref:hypothetical protein n=1 Tax=Alloalcanivorax marinus TaxID=1177169 RepID=UPI00193320EB|nr:hypothetical protein [Alloalcanivorax marinus]MBL7250764.1 hypothetical protein [Alloalcanivorax marinus]